MPGEERGPAVTAGGWTADRLAGALRTVEPGAATPELGHCFHADVFWHLVRGELGEKLTGEVLDHAAACPSCLQALGMARALTSASAPSRVSASLFPRWLVSPPAALAYLGLLLVLAILGFPAYQRRTPPSQPPPPAVAATRSMPAAKEMRSLRLLRLTGEMSLRGGAKTEPTRVALGADEALALKLFPELEDLPADPLSALTVRILDDAQELARIPRHRSDLEADESFLVLLDAGLLRAGGTYGVELSVDSPAPRVVLTQAFRIDAR